MAARKKATPNITLTDRVGGKSASLNDPQAVRGVLLDVLSRLDAAPADFDEKDATDVVVREIMSKAGSVPKAVKRIKESATIQTIFKGTSLEESAAETPTRGDAEVEQVPLPRGKDIEAVLTDLGVVVDELWPTLCTRIEKTSGEISQTITARITWNPPTENRDGYIGTSAAMSIQGGKRTRTGVVVKSKKKGGSTQFCLFDTPSDDE